MEIRLRTLTPLWTGGVNGECTKLRETSILGSLRWWFEAIVRGFGGYACDPTSNVKCEYNEDLKDICAACELFGTTGWAKRFRFEINQIFHKIYSGNLVIKGYRRNWYYPSGLVSCDSELNKIYETMFFESDLDTILRVLLLFISKWGMIGGKTAIGYGVARFEDENNNSLKVNGKDVEKFFYYIEEKRNHGKNVKNMPRLDEMFFAKFRFDKNCIKNITNKIGENIYVKNGIKQYPVEISECNGVGEEIDTPEKFLQRLKDYYSFIPTSALVRKSLRFKIRIQFRNHNLRHFLMGNIQTNKRFMNIDPTKFSAIQVSHIYWNGENWEFRIWGWIPKNLESLYGVVRSEVIGFIKRELNNERFWENVLSCAPEKPNGSNLLEYPEDNWNFVDLGKVSNVKDVFKTMVIGNE